MDHTEIETQLGVSEGSVELYEFAVEFCESHGVSLEDLTSPSWNQFHGSLRAFQVRLRGDDVLAVRDFLHSERPQNTEDYASDSEDDLKDVQHEEPTEEEE